MLKSPSDANIRIPLYSQTTARTVRDSCEFTSQKSYYYYYYIVGGMEETVRGYYQLSTRGELHLLIYFPSFHTHTA